MALRWMLQMAWRDSRGSRRWLGLFMGAMVVGVASVVAIQGFGANMRAAMDNQARLLLGADLTLERNGAFTSEHEALLDSLGGQQVRRISFASMAYFPEDARAHLVSVQAVEDGYPLYGKLETTPASAASHFVRNGQALVDASLMYRSGLVPGDSVRIGETMYAIGGGLKGTSQQSSIFATMRPQVFIPYAKLDTSLLDAGSRAEHEVYLRFQEHVDVASRVERFAPRLEALSLRYETPQEEQADWMRGLGALSRFLSLVAFVALLLGGLGVASAMHVYVKRRIDAVAVLRCLGASSRQTLGIYAAQALVIGTLCAAGGVAVGIVLQAALPAVLGSFLPVDVPFRLAPAPLLAALFMGLGVTLLFALLPLASVRQVAPLQALRAAFGGASESGVRGDPLRWLLLTLLAAGLTAAAVLQAADPAVGLGYVAGIAVACLLLVGLSAALRSVVRRFLPSSWPYVWRQGLANLYRPQNQTLLLTLTLGFGTFLLFTLYLLQYALLAQFTFADAQSRANILLFDVQPTQLAGVHSLVRRQGLPVLRTVPLVAMRLTSVRGVAVDSITADSTHGNTWAFTRQYQSTYRSHLSGTEEIIAGKLVDSLAAARAVVPVSVEEEIARDLGVGLGDTLTFDVQGVDMQTVVRSLRVVDWQQMSTNFFFVFPEGALEEAPQTYVVLTRTESEQASARLHAAAAEAFPGVLLFDLSRLIEVVSDVLEQVTFVIRFMALFSLAVGLLVLVGSVVISRVQRIRESVLLKTLGASRRQIYTLTAIEYLFVGLLAAAAGAVLAVSATWLLTYYLFESAFFALPWRVLLGVILVAALTVAIGVLGSRGVYRQPAIDALRDVR